MFNKNYNRNTFKICLYATLILALFFGNNSFATVVNLEATSIARSNASFKQFDNFTGSDAQGIWRSGYEFDTSSITQTATEVRLEIQYDTYSSSSASEAIQFFDSGWSPAFGTADAPSFGDLGSGVSYGSFNVASGGLTTDIVSFVLNASALADFNNNLGNPFRIGAVLNSLDGSGISGNEGVFRNSNNAGTQRLVVTVPEPTTLGLLGLGAMGILRRKRRM